MSLRARLILAVVGLLALGLVLALGATSGALQDWKGEQNDEVLTAAGEHLGAELSGPRGEGLAAAVGSAALWRGLAAEGDTPSWFQLRASNGEVRETVSYGLAPRPPEGLAGVDGQRFTDAPTALPGGEAGEPNWRIRAERLESGDVLLIGARTERSDELLSRTMTVAFVAGAVALLAVALLSWRAIRRGLRPLDDIAVVAGQIGDGDLARRVPPSPPNTEVGRLSVALNAMLGQLESAFAQRTESQERLRRFLADASHELRTPIATIRGHAELFRRGAASRPDDLEKVLRRIESESARMGDLVEELLVLARLDQGRRLERDPVRLAELAADAVSDALAVEPRRDITVDAAEVTVTGDVARLRQVFGNLLANVLRHTPVTASARVRVRRIDEVAVVEVADTGPGIPGDERGRVFERFYRADRTRSDEHAGAGLGLSIVDAVVLAHGGTATVESTQGEGTTVRIVLPMDPSPDTSS